MKGIILCCGEGNNTSTKLIRPKITVAYQPVDFKSECKVEEGYQEGLYDGKWMQFYGKKSNITSTSWIDALRTYLE